MAQRWNWQRERWGANQVLVAYCTARGCRQRAGLINLDPRANTPEQVRAAQGWDEQRRQQRCHKHA